MPKAAAKWQYIYAIQHPEKEIVYYVGKTSVDPRVRFDSHQKFPVSNRLRLTFQNLEAEGRTPIFVVLEKRWCGEKVALKREAVWIGKMRRAGHDLCNIHGCERSKEERPKLLSFPVSYDEYRAIVAMRPPDQTLSFFMRNRILNSDGQPPRP